MTSCCRQPPDLQLSLCRRVLIFLIGTIESMLFGGAVFGWPQLVHVLKVEGVYRDLCDNVAPPGLNHTRPTPDAAATFNNTRCLGLNTTFQVSQSQAVGVEKCDAQDERFALIYTLTVCCYSIPGVLVGYLLHHAGLRVTRISGGLMLTLGFLFLAEATKESPAFLFPAMVFLALGGNQTRMSVMQFGDLFPAHRATGITLLSGVYAASAALFLVFQYTAQMGVPREHVCWGLAAVSTLSVILTFLMPPHHIPVMDQGGAIDGEGRAPPLSDSLCSTSSLLHQLWFFAGLFAVNNYQQTYNVWVNRSSCSVSEAGLYTMLFSYSNLPTVFFGPIGGVFTDYMVKKARKTPSEVERRVKEVQASFWPLLVTSLCITGMYACIMFFQPSAIVVSLLCMIVARPCVIAISTAYLRIRFPAAHFNRLLGIYGTVTSTLLFLQYPHFIWAQHMYYAAHASILALLVFSWLNPIHLLFTPLMRHAVAVRDRLSKDDLRPVNT